MVEGRNIKEISIDFYHESLILSAILEAFIYCDEYSYTALNNWVFSFIDDELLHKVTITYYNKCFIKLSSLGLIDIIDLTGKGDNNSTIVKITEAGKVALQNQTFASLAQSILFNYQATLLNEETVQLTKTTVHLNEQIKWLTCAALLTAVVSAVVSIIALIISLKFPSP